MLESDHWLGCRQHEDRTLEQGGGTIGKDDDEVRIFEQNPQHSGHSDSCAICLVIGSRLHTMCASMHRLERSIATPNVQREPP